MVARRSSFKVEAWTERIEKVSQAKFRGVAAKEKMDAKVHKAGATPWTAEHNNVSRVVKR